MLRNIAVIIKVLEIGLLFFSALVSGPLGDYFRFLLLLFRCSDPDPDIQVLLLPFNVCFLAQLKNRSVASEVLSPTRLDETRTQ